MMFPLYLQRPSMVPGGIVIHVYSRSTGELLLEQKLLDLDMSQLYAMAGAEAVKDDERADDGIILIGWDGDTGQILGDPVFMGP